MAGRTAKRNKADIKLNSYDDLFGESTANPEAVEVLTKELHDFKNHPFHVNDDDDIQDTLGHADISTTLNIYADVTKDLKKAEFEGLDKWFAKSMGQKNCDKNTDPETGDGEEGDS